MALYGIVFLGSTPIGAPIAGVIGEHLGAQTGLWLSGLVAAGLGVALLGLGRRHARVARVEEQEAVDAGAASAIASQ